MAVRYGTRNFFFYHGFADLLRHIRILSILRAHFGLIRCIHRQINARGRLAYRLVITAHRHIRLIYVSVSS